MEETGFAYFKEMLKEFSDIMSFNVLLGIAVMVVLIIAEIKFIRNKGIKNKRQERRLEKAKSLGHAVTAIRLEQWKDTPVDPNSWVHATYAYEVNGKYYKYRFMEREAAPRTITLYYINNPHKTFRGTVEDSVFLMLLFYILPVAAGILTISLLGGI